MHDERNGEAVVAGAVVVGRFAADAVATAAAVDGHIAAGTVAAASAHRHVTTATHSIPETPAVPHALQSPSPYLLALQHPCIPSSLLHLFTSFLHLLPSSHLHIFLLFPSSPFHLFILFTSPPLLP